MLTSYAGIVKKGQILLPDNVDLPEGAQVIVVVSDHALSLEQQAHYLADLPAEEWRAIFGEFAQISGKQPAEVDIETIDDNELVRLVHQVRAARP